MKKVELICIGGQKFKELKPLEQSYQKKINFFIQFTITNLKEIKLKNESLIKVKESAAILDKLNAKDFVIILDEKGKQMDSKQFSNFFEDKISYHSGKIIFIIGGFNGMSDELLNRGNAKLSLSLMTMPHDLCRVVFMEQLYRALTIQKNITYHR